MYRIIAYTLLVVITALSGQMASNAMAQELTAPQCAHDPYPSEEQNIPVSCDDPSCNVGPCTNAHSNTTSVSVTTENTENLHHLIQLLHELIALLTKQLQTLHGEETASQ